MANRRGRRGRTLLSVLHYITSLGWLGVGFCQLTLNLIALVTGDPALRHAAHEITQVFDRALLAGLALLATATGVLLCTRTGWGLIRHWWIVVKLVLTFGLLVFSSVWLGGWADQAITATATNPAAPGYRGIRTELIVGSVSELAVLTVIVVISVVKPWGRTPVGRRLARQRSRSSSVEPRQPDRLSGAEPPQPDRTSAAGAATDVASVPAATSGPVAGRRAE